ncbi:hypothetical protein BGAL_0452g00020 [Botrytis galanthina]|uniref:Uncharacterized protein n=1 Tax=Botrytis galanthina TaxID=278940 RepID=A0A4V4HTJ4_9HELO|nr:hypothetical protein BGAL_0452g00020 [Botrytis galanthina]
MVFVPPPLITHDHDFRATEDYINSLRDEDNHPAAWKEPELVPADLKVKPNMVYRPVSDFLAANQLPKVEGQQKRLKVKAEYTADLPPTTISLVKSIYLIQRAIDPDEFAHIQPAYLTRYSGNSHDRAHYCRAVNGYASQLEREILERMRNVTSSMIAEAIYTDEFQEICRSDNAREDLELFFAENASNDQLYYVYSKLWTAIHFGFVMDNNVRPNAQEETGIPVYFSDDEGSDDESMDSHTLADEENKRWENHDAVSYDHDHARSNFKGGWRQLVINWKMASTPWDGLSGLPARFRAKYNKLRYLKGATRGLPAAASLES